MNLHWYYIFQRNWPAILEATKRDMGVFIISPSDKGGLLYDPSPKLVELCQPLHPIVFNDLFCLLRPEIHTLSIGAARPSDFDRHVEAVNLLAKAKELVPPIAARLDAAYNAAVPAGRRNPFQMNLPEPEATPGEINIPIILWLLNLVKAYDMTAYGQMRYNLLGSGGHWFPGKPATDLGNLNLDAIATAAGLGSQLKPLLAEAHGLLAKDAVKRLSQS